jgi:hypothetical protein
MMLLCRATISPIELITPETIVSLVSMAGNDVALLLCVEIYPYIGLYLNYLLCLLGQVFVGLGFIVGDLVL